MIYFIMTRRNNFPIRNLLRTGGKHLVDKIRIIDYEDISEMREIRAGTFIFSDFDFLDDQQRIVVRGIYDELTRKYEGIPVLNDPSKALLRYDLLKKAYETGVNSFMVYRGNEDHGNVRFPVFIREADRHSGALTNLIQNKEDLNDQLERFKRLGFNLENLLVIEFLDSSDHEGVYVKYSAFRLGDKILPRYLNFSRDWHVKATLARQNSLMKDRQNLIHEYMSSNPHEKWLMEVFEMANIEYGRADYSIVNGKLQLWEINLNPAFVRTPGNVNKDNDQQRFMRDAFYKGFFDQIEKVNFESPESVKLEISKKQEQSFKRPIKRRLIEGYQARLFKPKARYRMMLKVSELLTGA